MPLFPPPNNPSETTTWGNIAGTLSDQTDLESALAGKETANSNIQAHVTSTSNPHSVTKAQVGLGSVDNTADTAKPVSTATQTALNLKAPLASPAFTGTVAGVTKAMVGLTSVDDTSDAGKPVSTATQTALNLKANLASPTFTGTVVIPTPFTVGAISVTATGTEINQLVGATSAIQGQINTKQATLVSATNIKTVNGSTLLGSGDLVVSGQAATFNPNLQTTAVNQTIPALNSVFLLRKYVLTSTAQCINHGFVVLKN